MRFAVCNELFQGMTFNDTCALVRSIGFDGIEIAPFTVCSSLTELSPDARRDLRRTAESHSLAITGLHWLLAAVPGVHLTSENPAVRQVTCSYLQEAVRACADLGGEVVVLGSPKQRNIPPGVSREHALDWSFDTFRQVAKTAEERGVTFCLEPLAPVETNLFSTAAEAAEMVDRVGSPNFRLILDVKAMSSESVPIPRIIQEQRRRFVYFHANDANLREPGAGDSDFRQVFQALHSAGYDGWVSIEVFVYQPDPAAIAKRGLDHLRATRAAALG